MKLRRAWLFVVLLAALAIVILLGREPHYQGRSLTSWLQQSWDTPLMETQRLAEAQNAIRGIGAKKVLPKLLKLVQSEDDPISMTIMHIGDEFRISDDIGDRIKNKRTCRPHRPLPDRFWPRGKIPCREVEWAV